MLFTDILGLLFGAAAGITRIILINLIIQGTKQTLCCKLNLFHVKHTKIREAPFEISFVGAVERVVVVENLVSRHNLFLHDNFHFKINGRLAQVVVVHEVTFEVLRMFHPSRQADLIVLGLVAVQETNRILEHHTLQNHQHDGTIMNFDHQLVTETRVGFLDSEKVLLWIDAVAQVGAHGALFVVIVKVDIVGTNHILDTVGAFVVRGERHVER